MLFEIASVSSMAAVVGTTYYMQQKQSTNDHEKIKTIADAAGLKTKDGSIRIYRKHKTQLYTEYVYKMPLGLSSKQFKDNKQLFVDGLNNKSQHNLDFSQFKNIDWKGDVIKQVQEIFNNRVRLDKHLEIEYDGMLKFRVFPEGLSDMYEYDQNVKKAKWIVPIGYTYRGLMTHDFDKRSHMIVAGTTGFGKSEFLRMLVTTLINQEPDNVRLHLIDLKGGNEMRPFLHTKQCVNFARTTTESKEVLEDIQLRMGDKLDEIFDHGNKGSGSRKRDFIVIDEAGELDDASKEITTDIARRGRAAGYRLIYATQYPTNETLPSQVRANIGARVCFRLETNVQSRAVLDEGGAEELPEIEGRAIFRRVNNYIVQVPYMHENQINNIIEPYINISTKEGLSDRRKNRKHPVKFEAL